MSDQNDFVRGWLGNEQEAQDVIKVKRIYIDINDDELVDGLMFSQIMYWHGHSTKTGKPRLQVSKGGHLWLAKTAQDWWEECRVNEHAARRALIRMEKRGLIIKKVYKYAGAPTTHIRVDWEVFEQKVKSIWQLRSNPIEQIAQIQLSNLPISITETETKTTTDIKDCALENSAHPLEKKLTTDAAGMVGELAGTPPIGDIPSRTQKLPPPPPGMPNPPKKKLTAQQQMVKALSMVTSLDAKIKTNAGRLARRGGDLLSGGYTSEQVEAGYCLGGWWYENDWRGQKGQPPTPEDVCATIAQYLASVPQSKAPATVMLLQSDGTITQGRRI